MNLRRIDLNLLTIFDAIMSEGSITRAAARLGMTQPALSNALTRLRRLVDDPLFVRVGNRIVPTERAAALSGPIRQALEIAERALGANPDEEDATEGPRCFTLALGDAGEAIALPAAFAKLKREGKRPVRLTLRRHAPDPAAELKRGTIDLAWLSETPPTREISVEPVMKDEIVCVLAGATGRKKMTRDFFFALEHAAIAGAGHERQLDKNGRKRRIAIEFAHHAPLAALVAETELAATMPRRVAEHYAALHDLAIVPLPFDMPDALIHQAWPRALDGDREHGRLRNALKAAAR